MALRVVDALSRAEERRASAGEEKGGAEGGGGGADDWSWERARDSASSSILLQAGR